MPQYLAFNETSTVKIFDNQVTGDFTALTLDTDLFSLGMDRTVEELSINNFSVTITNEATVTTGSGSFILLLQTSTTGSGNVTGTTAGTWNTIGTVTLNASAGIISDATLPTTPVIIAAGDYIRLRPSTAFRTDQESFHVLVEGERLYNG